MDAPDDVRRLRDEVARLEEALEAERRTAEQWRRIAEDRRVTLERLRQRLVVRWLFRLAKIVMPKVRRVHDRVDRARRQIRSAAAAIVGARHRITAKRREQRLREQVRALPESPTSDRSTSAVVLTHNGLEHLERLLPALDRTHHQELEVIVVDNGSDRPTREFLDRYPGIRVVRNDVNRSYAEANNMAAAEASGDLLLFLNDDVEPLDPTWLSRMLDAYAGDVGAVGAQLVYPRQPLLSGGRTRDISIQHLGIEFVPDEDGGVPIAQHTHRGEDPDPRDSVTEVAAATGACLLVERSLFERCGGFDTRYMYGAEDVDLCWRLRRAGRRVVVTHGAVLYHPEGSTRHRSSPPRSLQERQRRNWTLLAAKLGPELRRAVDLDRLGGHLALSRRPYRVALTVTRDYEPAGYGDYYTAHELGDAFERNGWEVSYIERYRDAWYAPPTDLDAIVVLHDTFDIRRIARPGLTTVAWVRNWTERWLSHPWFEELDLVVVSSELSAQLVMDGSRHRRPPVVPLATNPSRFVGAPAEERTEVVLTANRWGEPRGVAELVRAVPEIQLYGKGWEEVTEVQAAWRGTIPYDQLPDLYGRAAIVVDQTAGPTRAIGALNSRVFDALASGALVITDQREGADEIFSGRLPTYSDGPDLAQELRRWLASPEERARRVDELRRLVLDAHTYTARAKRFQEILEARSRRPGFVVKISAPDRKEARTWGDTFFAEGLIRELRAAGHRTTLQTMDEWEDIHGYAFEIALHLKGRSRASRTEGQVHAIWVISHPDELDPDEVDIADVVFSASRQLTEHLADGYTTPVHHLPQATDERRFRPRPRKTEHEHEVAFVGNSRFVERPAVRDALSMGLRPAIYGANWERFVGADLIVTRFIRNEELADVYSSVKVLLNDHWEDMRTWGLVSNRIFDALACGACVVSDPVIELSDLFGTSVATYRTPAELREVVSDLLSDPERRHAMGEEGRRRVLDHHTFRHRVDSILDAIAPHVEQRRDVEVESLYRGPAGRTRSDG